MTEFRNFPQLVDNEIVKLKRILDSNDQPSEKSLGSLFSFFGEGRRLSVLASPLPPSKDSDGLFRFQSDLSDSLIIGTSDKLLALPCIPLLANKELTNVVFVSSVFSGVNLSGIRVSKAVFAGTSTDRASRSTHGVGIDLSGSNLEQVVFAYVDLRGMRAFATAFDKVVFNEVDLTGALFCNYAEECASPGSSDQRTSGPRTLAFFGDDDKERLPVEYAAFQCQDMPPSDFYLYFRNLDFRRCLFSGFFKPTRIDNVCFFDCRFDSLLLDGSSLDSQKEEPHRFDSKACSVKGLLDISAVKHAEIELNSVSFEDENPRIQVSDCSLQSFKVLVSKDACCDSLWFSFENCHIRDFQIVFEDRERARTIPIHIEMTRNVEFINPVLENLELHIHQLKHDAQDGSGFRIVSEVEAGSLRNSTIRYYENLDRFLHSSFGSKSLDLSSCSFQPCFVDTDHFGPELLSADFTNAYLSETVFEEGTILRECKFAGMKDVVFNGCTLSSCSFEPPERIESLSSQGFRAHFKGHCRFETSAQNPIGNYFRRCSFDRNCDFRQLENSTMDGWVLSESSVFPSDSLRRLTLRKCQLDDVNFMSDNDSDEDVHFHACVFEEIEIFPLPPRSHFYNCSLTDTVLLAGMKEVYIDVNRGTWSRTTIMPSPSLSSGPKACLFLHDDLKLNECVFQDLYVCATQPEKGSRRPILRGAYISCRSDHGRKPVPLFKDCHFDRSEALAQNSVLSDFTLEALEPSLKNVDLTVDSCQLLGEMKISALQPANYTVVFVRSLIPDFASFSASFYQVKPEYSYPSIYADAGQITQISVDGALEYKSVDGSKDDWDRKHGYPTPCHGAYSRYVHLLDDPAAKFMVDFRHTIADGVKSGNTDKESALRNALGLLKTGGSTDIEGVLAFKKELDDCVEKGLLEDSSRRGIIESLEGVRMSLESLAAARERSESLEAQRTSCLESMQDVEECFLHRLNRKPAPSLNTSSIDEWLRVKMHLTSIKQGIPSSDTRKVFFDYGWLESFLTRSIDEVKAENPSGLFIVTIQVNDEHVPSFCLFHFGSENTPPTRPRLTKDFMDCAPKKAFAYAYSWKNKWEGELPDSLSCYVPPPQNGLWFCLYVEIVSIRWPIGGISCNEYEYALSPMASLS